MGLLLVASNSTLGSGIIWMLDGIELPLKAPVRNLGVLLDSALLLEVQVAAVARNAYYQLRLLCQLRPIPRKKDLATVTNLALVTSRLDYCNMLYTELSLKTA